MADFTAMQTNFFEVGEPDNACLSRPGFGDTEFIVLARTFDGELVSASWQLARSSISVDSLPLDNAWEADLTGDGIIDFEDIRAFAWRYGVPLLPEFQAKLARFDEVKVRTDRDRE